MQWTVIYKIEVESPLSSYFCLRWTRRIVNTHKMVVVVVFIKIEKKKKEEKNLISCLIFIPHSRYNAWMRGRGWNDSSCF